ncbi:hypothetical protein POM88_004362 [Heracleum sosnowskyi]|uniref:Uncharacterized protein n=1 Tax=Heracleum sosnowskyi TaxID=360622 RepID=A0AAD8JLI0_9APIA|nr:hypothetical protein POM88_004362 [Heracleum sosnowskyi]
MNKYIYLQYICSCTFIYLDEESQTLKKRPLSLSKTRLMAAFLFLLLPSKEIIIATSPAETFDDDIDIGILLFIVGSSGYLLWKGYGRLKVKGNRDKLYTFYSTTL